MISIAMMAGILASHYLHLPIALWLLLGGVGLIVLIACFTRRRNNIIASTIAAIVLCASVGGGLHYAHYHHIPSDDISFLLPDDEQVFTKIRGVICSDPIIMSKSPVIIMDLANPHLRYETAFELRVNALPANGNLIPASGTINVKVYDANEELRYGDEVELVGRLQVPNTPTNPGQFNYREYLRRQGVRAIIYVSSNAGVEPTGVIEHSMQRKLLDARRHMLSLLEDASGGNASIAAAMLLGVRSEVSAEAIESFQHSGTMHLLAISGLHVGMIAAAFILLMRILRVPLKIGNLLMIACLILYVLLTGSRPPAVRAMVVIGAGALGSVFGRRQFSINSIGTAACIILLFSPCELLNRGFQLSFMAFIAIGYFYKPIRNLLYRLRSQNELLQDSAEWSLWLRLWVHVRQVMVPLIAVSLAASIGVVPLIAYSFNIVSVAGLVCNVFMVPLAWVVVVSGVSGMVLAVPLSAVWGNAGLLLWPAVTASRVLEAASQAAASISISHFHTAPPLWFVVAYYCILLVMIHRRVLNIGQVPLYASGLILLNVLVIGAVWPRHTDFRVTFFDVRHGNCVFIEFESGKTLLYDCGTSSNFFDVGAYVVAPALWQRGIFKIDAIILSHPHADHINGVLSLPGRFKIGKVFVPPGFSDEPLGAYIIGQLSAAGIPIHELAAPAVIEFGPDRIEILSPPEHSPLQAINTPNNRSLVARVSAGEHRLLLAGDIEMPAISWLLNSGQCIESDVLLVPHHGSYAENIADLAAATGATSAIISAARNSPDSRTLDILLDSNMFVYQTGDMGAISVTLEGGALLVNAILLDVRPMTVAGAGILTLQPESD